MKRYRKQISIPYEVNRDRYYFGMIEKEFESLTTFTFFSLPLSNFRNVRLQLCLSLISARLT